MNRRELAKNTCFGLLGYLAAKLIPEQPTMTLGTESTMNLWAICYEPDGKWTTETMIDTNLVPPGWDFLTDPCEDGYNV